MKPMTKEEVYAEMVKYCDKVLEILKDWEGSNDHPPGRIIYQCEWLKQEIERNRLPVPFYNMIHNIRHTYVDGDMPDEAYEKGIQRYLNNIIILSDGHRLVTPEYYPDVVEDIDRLLSYIENSGLMDHVGARELVKDLERAKGRILAAMDRGEEVIPFERKEFEFFGDGDYFQWGDSVFEDIPELDHLIYVVASELFEGEFTEGGYADPRDEASPA